MTKKILGGVRIIDQTMWQMGPVGTMMLAAMGAEVIHIEPPEGDPGRTMPIPLSGGQGKGRFGENLSAYFENNNRGKKSMVIDLAKPRAREVLYQLVTRSDVYVHNLRPGIARLIGCDYDTLRKYNAGLIYSSASSFGIRGPDGEKPGFDMSGAARSGAMYMVPNEAGNPVMALGSAYDQIGAIFEAFAVVSALLARERYGTGQKVENSQLASSMWLMNLMIQATSYAKIPRFPQSPRSMATNPLWNWYQCADGEWIALCMVQAGRHWPAVCDALGMDEAIRNAPRFKDTAARAKNAGEVVALFDNIFISKPRDEWIKAFEGKDIFWEKVQKFADLPDDPQVIANEYMVDYNHPLTGEVYKYQHLPVVFSETPAKGMGRAPLLGEHTEEILVDILGYQKEDVPRILDEIGRPAQVIGTTVIKTD